jgi:hypothetical protein
MKRIALAFGLALAATVAQAGVIQSVEDAGIYTTQVAGATTVNWNDYSCGAYTNCTGNGALVSGSMALALGRSNAQGWRAAGSHRRRLAFARRQPRKSESVAGRTSVRTP